MQFKVFSIFATATLVAAGTVPQNAQGNGGTTNLGGASTNSGGATNINPPISGNPAPTITPSQCPSGELHCCKLIFNRSL
jgi:hypothetical protein